MVLLNILETCGSNHVTVKSLIVDIRHDGCTSMVVPDAGVGDDARSISPGGVQENHD